MKEQHTPKTSLPALRPQRLIYVGTLLTLASLTLATIPAPPAGADTMDLLFGASSHCDSGSGFGSEAGDCPISCERGSSMYATMTTKNGDPNIWVHAAIDCADAADANTCPQVKSCSTRTVTSSSYAKGWCHGKVANENGDWYRWKLYCKVTDGEDFESPVDLDVTIEGTFAGYSMFEDCEEAIAVGAHDTPGQHRSVSGFGPHATAIAFGDGSCYAIPVHITHLGGLLSVTV